MDRKKMNTSREVSRSRKKLTLVPSRMSLSGSAAGIPANEQDRLAALHAYRILDTENEQAYDDLVKLASDLFGVPIAQISLVDEKRQFIKSSVGLPRADAPREHSFCAHAVFDNTPLVVLDSLRNPRFATNPLVTGDPEVRFYAGVPLRVGKGLPLGAFCLIDRKPRATFSDAELFRSSNLPISPQR